MIGLLPILARWKAGIGIAAIIGLFGLALAANHYRHAYHAEKALRKAQEAAYVAAQAIATQKAQAALVAAEAHYRSKANEADKSYRAGLADARAAADAYTAAHRVRAASGRAASTTVASAEDHGPGVPASLPADAVMVSAGDVQACTDAAAYALTAHDWAMTLPH